MELTDEEQKAIEQARLAKEKQKACFEEIKVVLDKYGFNLSVTQPQLTLVPRASNG